MIPPLRDIEERWHYGDTSLVTLKLSCGHLETRRTYNEPKVRARCSPCGTAILAQKLKERVPGLMTGAEIRADHHAVGPGITDKEQTMAHDDDDGPALPEGYIHVGGLDGDICLAPDGSQVTMEKVQLILAEQQIEAQAAEIPEVDEELNTGEPVTLQLVTRDAGGELVLVDPVGVEIPEPGQQLVPATQTTPPTKWMDSDPAELRAVLDLRQLNRDALMEWLAEAMVEGVDFGKIHVMPKRICDAGAQCTNPTHWSKNNLWKAGAEKICGMLGLRATWPNLDAEMASIKGGAKIIILRCELLDQHDQVQGDGVGGRSLEDDNGNINKALKMAKKSSMVDAVLVAGGLSEVFTQDLVAPGGGGDPDDQAPDPLDEYGQQLLKRTTAKLFRHQLEPEGEEGTASPAALEEMVESILQSLACRAFRIETGDWRTIPAFRLQDALRRLEDKAQGELPVQEAT